MPQDLRVPPEDDKKKNKLRDFAEHSAVRTTPAVGRPSKYALKKLADFEYVELYYFTVNACKEAAECERSMADDTFTLSKVDDTIALRLINAHKPSTKTVPDARLTWNDISIAKTKLLQCMQDAKWPPKFLMSLAGFYVNLDSHPIREEEGGEQAIIQYQSEVRREWIDAITGNGPQEPFDISSINDERLRRIAAKILYQRQLNAVQRSVESFSHLTKPSSDSIPPPTHAHTATTRPSPFPIPIANVFHAGLSRAHPIHPATAPANVAMNPAPRHINTKPK